MSYLTGFFLPHGIEEPIIKPRADSTVNQDLLLAGENREAWRITPKSTSHQNKGRQSFEVEGENGKVLLMFGDS